MTKQKLHPEGPEFSRVIAGAWRWHTVSSQVVERLIDTALDSGITTFDHADIYGDHGNEEIFGNILKKTPSLRSGMELVSKCGIKFPSSKRPATWIKHYDTSKEHILWSTENSLSMLGTNHLDLLLIHRPDPLLNPTEVAEAFTKLKKDGKVLHFGVSNFTPSQFRVLQRYLDFPLVTNQIEISLSRIDPFFNGDLDTLMEFKASPMAWSPLAGGKTLSVEEREIFNKASKYNASYSQLALAWLMKHPSNIFPIIGTTQPERIAEASRSNEITIDLQDWFEMLKWVMGKEMP
ncbi:MAG: aldo/keto reductase [Cyclobacteriaceae bacterium]|nr:aldo/keto reductase [Cyclobacteriaceae bacterium]